VHGPLDGALEIGELDRLDQIVGCPTSKCRRRGHRVVDGGEHDDRQLGIRRQGCRHRFDARHAGEMDVEERNGEPLGRERLEPRLGAVRHANVVAP
jgi:hypothetical protein